jgi:hypothetical protein
MSMGSLMLVVVGRNLLMERGGGMEKKLADLAIVRQKETREDQDDANERGGRSPVRRLGNLDRGVTQGQ